MQRPFPAYRDHPQPAGTIPSLQGPSQACKDHPQPAGTIPSLQGPFPTCRDHPSPAETIPSLQGPSPDYKDHSLACRDHPQPIASKHSQPMRMISIQTTTVLPWFAMCCFCEKPNNHMLVEEATGSRLQSFLHACFLQGQDKPPPPVHPSLLTLTKP